MRPLLKRLLLASGVMTATCLAGGLVFADDAPGVADIAVQGNLLRQSATVQPVPDWLRKADAGTSGEATISEQARSIADQFRRSAESGGTPPIKGGQHFELFVSWSLGDAALRDMLKEVAGREDTIVVFRGLREGDRIPDAIQRVHRLIEGITPPPNVSIDPPLFEKRGVQSVPEIVVADGEAVKLHVSGIGSVLAVQSMMSAGKAGELGAQGPTREIEEADLIQVMKTRMAALDLTGARDRAITTYWKKASFEELPPAEEFRDRLIDPTVAVTRDVRAPDGKLLVKQGQRINPLSVMPFTSQVVVFDATSEDQVRIVEKLLAATLDGNRPIVLIATAIDRDAGWEGLKGLDERLHQPVYLLNGDLRQRFRLERVPSLIVAEGKSLLVREIAVRRK